MPISLLIKGAPHEAAAALKAHGFKPANMLTPPTLLHTNSSHVASVASVRDEMESDIQRWFAETADLSSLPFPVGTLLHYVYSR